MLNRLEKQTGRISGWELTSRARRWTIIAIVVGYILVFPGIYPLVSHFYFIFGVIPIIVAGLLGGFRAAIYTVIVISVIHFSVLVGPLGHPLESAFVESLPLTTLLIGGAVGYLRDVRAELTREREKLKRRNEHLDEFTNIVSHDLQNPLHAAMGGLELAQEDCDSEHLETVDRSLERIESLIDDTLTLARAGERVRETEVADLSALFETAGGTVDTKDATLVIDTDRSIQADRGLSQQLLENLIRNAVEHGGENVTITVGDLADGFYVEDDGSGIPDEKQENVFEVGYSTGETETGLGLNIVKRIAEAHGWTVTVRRGSNGGARFEFTDVASPPDGG